MFLDGCVKSKHYSSFSHISEIECRGGHKSANRRFLCGSVHIQIIGQETAMQILNGFSQSSVLVDGLVPHNLFFSMSFLIYIHWLL